MKNVYSFGTIAVILIIIHVASSLLNAQSPLIPVSDAANPIVNDAGIAAVPYTGCAWVDYDNDGDLETSTSPTTAHKLPDWQTRSTAMTAAGALQKSRMLVQLQRTWGFRSVQSGAIWTTTATLIAS